MQEHRLSAIMFTDIAGYTALMGSDEKRAFEMLQKNRNIHTGLLKKYNGVLIKEMGDGMLISFDLGSDAVRYAIEIQIASKEQNIPLRIGIHEGELVFEDSDVFGDGVNIASRLQEAADVGSILITEPVYRDVKNKADIHTRFLEEKYFKNVNEQVKIYNVLSEELPATDASSVYSEKNKFLRRPLLIQLLKTISVIILAIGVVATIFFLYGTTTIPFTERDWIVITDFENLTDETILDHSLNTAFILSVNQSRYLNVLTRRRMIATLKRMERESSTGIDEEIGREIAIREGIQIFVVPTISRVGSQYILTARIQEAQTANILKSEVLYANSQDEIIGKLEQLSRKLRRRLGESRIMISNHSKPLKEATTSSLEALKQYSLGIESHLRLDFKKARSHYENAIRLDSNFTAAKASLGNILYEKFDRDEGRKWLDKAIVSIDNLTDREKFGILAFYAVNVENDLEKGIGYTEKRLGLYPDDPVAHNNLGWYLQNQGKYDSALDEYKMALKINPYMMLTNSGIIWIYLDYYAQIDSAMTWSNRMIKNAPDNPWGYFYLGSVHVGLNELQKAEAAYLKAQELNSNFSMNQYRLAHVYRLQGKYTEAIKVLETLLRENPHEFSANYDLGVNYNALGKHELARAHFLKYKEIAETWLVTNPDDQKSYIYNGIVRTKLGDKEGGWNIGKKALDMEPPMYFEFAQLMAVQDRKIEAIDYLEKALDNGYKNLVWIKLHADIQLLHEEDRFKELIHTYFGNP
ncbi:MAG: tetratricopeptide repeat protein [Eudoraea sp.]|nr:tetratricopeptide repeat protein [Eudoraea sp.]